MPPLLQGNIEDKFPALQRPTEHYPYTYPTRNLKPGTPLHDKLRNEILLRAKLSADEMSKRHDTWRQMDQLLTAYVPLSEAEKSLKKSDSTRPVSIVVPLSYATLETLLTYMSAAFLEGPLFRYNGVGDEDVIGAALLERVIDREMRKSKAILAVHTWLRDAFTYGIGVCTPEWTTKMAFKSVKPSGIMHKLMPRSYFARDTEEYVAFEGNALRNVDPYTFYPDVSSPIQNVQEMEYVGWLRRESRNEILRRERHDPLYFNGQYLTGLSGVSILGEDKSERNRDNVGGRDRAPNQTLTSPVDVVYMYIDIIPSEWGLGRYTTPEKWLFGLAADQIIITAAPVNLNHNMLPISAISPDFDGYSTAPLGRLEMVHGMQHLVNFLYNSHVANVRKALHDMFLVDPDMVNIKDVQAPGPGKLIRLRRAAWGRDVRTAMHQLSVSDVTQNHIAEAIAIAGQADKSAGTGELTQGILRRGSERISAQEFSSTARAAMSKFERIARVISVMGMYDLGYMVASQTQQFMSQDAYVEIAGSYEEQLRGEYQIEARDGRVPVNPYDLMIDYDVRVSDGSVPNVGDPNQWLQMLQLIGAYPQLAQGFDVTRIFKHWARLGGSKNVEDFIIHGGNEGIQVQSDNVIRNGAQAGNLVPLEDYAA